MTLKKGLPVKNNRIKYLYGSHFLEHLPFKKGFKFLTRAYKAMKQGGIIRLSVPDLELWVRKYYENDLSFFEKYRSLYLKTSSQLVNTKGQIFGARLHGFGHKSCYDFESLKDILGKAGFSNITKKTAFESAIPNIKELEPSDEGRLLESLYAEAEKK